jgi:hypothetical protein
VGGIDTVVWGSRYMFGWWEWWRLMKLAVERKGYEGVGEVLQKGQGKRCCQKEEWEMWFSFHGMTMTISTKGI